MKIPFLIILFSAVLATGCPSKQTEVEEPTPDVTPEEATEDCQPGDPGCEEEEVMVEEDEGALDDKQFVEDAPYSGGDDEEPLEGGPEE